MKYKVKITYEVDVEATNSVAAKLHVKRAFRLMTGGTSLFPAPSGGPSWMKCGMLSYEPILTRVIISKLED